MPQLDILNQHKFVNNIFNLTPLVSTNNMFACLLTWNLQLCSSLFPIPLPFLLTLIFTLLQILLNFSWLKIKLNIFLPKCYLKKQNIETSHRFLLKYLLFYIICVSHQEIFLTEEVKF